MYTSKNVWEIKRSNHLLKASIPNTTTTAIQFHHEFRGVKTIAAKCNFKSKNRNKDEFERL
jgi:hypothetical protein